MHVVLMEVHMDEIKLKIYQNMESTQNINKKKSSIFTDQCGSNSKMVQGLEPPDEQFLLTRSQPHLSSRQIFFEQQSRGKFFIRHRATRRIVGGELRDRFAVKRRKCIKVSLTTVRKFHVNSFPFCSCFWNRHGVWIRFTYINTRQYHIRSDIPGK